MKFKPGPVREAAGKRLEQVRKEWNLDRAAMAARFGQARISYYKNERGVSLPGLGVMYRLSNQYDISMEWLLFGKGPKRISEWNRLTERAEELEKKLVHHEEQSAQQLESAEKRALHAESRVEACEQNLIKTKRLLETADERFLDKQKPGVKELLEHIDKDSKFYHKIILYFEEYKEKQGKKEVPGE